VHRGSGRSPARLRGLLVGVDVDVCADVRPVVDGII
jgi:hypothetical protein